MLGTLEFIIAEILWEAEDASVHEVAARLHRPLAYTTVMTTLDRLYKKGFLNRRKADRAFRYAPKFTRAEWEKKRAGEWFAEFFASSPRSGDLLISCLVDAVGEQDSTLLDELERKINAKRQELQGSKAQAPE